MTQLTEISLIVFAIATLGCGVHVGPTGIDVVLAGSFYSHTDSQGDGRGDGDEGDGSADWHTHAARTWGTSGTEWVIDEGSERGSITGNGMSSVMGKVLGEDLGEEALKIASCALQPLQPGCAGIEPGVEFLPTLRELLETSREDRADGEISETPDP